jgi:hypothetical protein
MTDQCEPVALLRERYGFAFWLVLVVKPQRILGSPLLVLLRRVVTILPLIDPSLRATSLDTSQRGCICSWANWQVPLLKSTLVRLSLGRNGW